MENIIRIHIAQHLFKQGDAEEMADDGKANQIVFKSMLSKMKEKIFERGEYKENNYKCQSSKTFNDLMQTNQLFKELKG